MLWFRLAIFFLLVALSPAYAAGETAYVLGPNDKVKVTVFGEPDLSGEFEISGSGVMSMPLIGEIPLGGKNLTQASEALSLRLRDGFLRAPKVSIEVLNYRPFFILGEVNSPGSYPYVNGMTVVNAAAIGGGFTYRADKKDIKIQREAADGKAEMPAQLESVVRPGDVIWVGERFF